MKTLFKILSVVLVLFLTSCVDETSLVDEIKDSPNLIGFVNRNGSISGIANGNEYSANFPIQAFGPTSYDLSGTFTAKVSVDPSSTAVEGTHFELTSTTITVTSEGNLLGNFPVTMLTEGIEAPLASAPVIVLNLTEATGGVIASGAQLNITLNYLCNSTLDEESYAVSGTYVRAASGINTTFDHGIETLTKKADGVFQTMSTGHWGAGALSPPAAYDGFIFTDVCGVITIEEQNLGGYYSNLVEGSGYVDENGDIHLEYTVCASDCREFTAVYVKQ